MRWFWFLCLTIGAVSDLRERTVSCRVLAVCKRLVSNRGGDLAAAVGRSVG